MGLTNGNLQVALDRFVTPLNRFGYIRSEIGGEDWRFVNAWLTPGLVKSHLNQQLYIGQRFPERGKDRWTDRIVLDCDDTSQSEFFIDLMKKVTDQTPTLIFTTPFSGGFHLYYFLDRTINIRELTPLKALVNAQGAGGHRVELWPCRKALRLPLGEGSFWVDRMGEVVFPDVNDSLKAIGDSFEDRKVDLVDVSKLRARLRTLSEKKNLQNLGGEFWDKVKRAEEIGISEPGTRNENLLALIGAWYQRGLSLDETTESGLNWLANKVGPILSKDVANWRESQFRAEIKASYRYCQETFDPTRRGGIPLTFAELKEVYLTVKPVLDKVDPRWERRRKTYKLACLIYQLCKSMRTNTVRIPHTLLDRWGFRRDSRCFDPFKLLLNAGLIAIHSKPFNIAGGKGRATAYLVCFSDEKEKTTPLIEVIPPALPALSPTERKEKGRKSGENGEKGGVNKLTFLRKGLFCSSCSENRQPRANFLRSD